MIGDKALTSGNVLEVFEPRGDFDLDRFAGEFFNPIASSFPLVSFALSHLVWVDLIATFSSIVRCDDLVLLDLEPFGWGGSGMDSKITVTDVGDAIGTGDSSISTSIDGALL